MISKSRLVSNIIFADIKQASIAVWEAKPLHPDYLKEKIDKILRLTNYQDNWYSMVGMFDQNNQVAMFDSLQLQDSRDFLIKMKPYYAISTRKSILYF